MTIYIENKKYNYGRVALLIFALVPMAVVVNYKLDTGSNDGRVTKAAVTQPGAIEKSSGSSVEARVEPMQSMPAVEKAEGNDAPSAPATAAGYEALRVTLSEEARRAAIQSYEAHAFHVGRYDDIDAYLGAAIRKGGMDRVMAIAPALHKQDWMVLERLILGPSLDVRVPENMALLKWVLQTTYKPESATLQRMMWGKADKEIADKIDALRRVLGSCYGESVTDPLLQSVLDNLDELIDLPMGRDRPHTCSQANDAIPAS